MKCPNCFKTLVRDDIEVSFKGCYEDYLICKCCPVSCILSVRFGKPFKAYWHDESNGSVKDWVQSFID